MIRKVSAKKLASLGGKLPFSTISSAPKKRIRKKPRSKSERERIYGPPGYIEWIHARPCEICGKLPSECVHIETDGMGRKAGFEKIVAFCRHHHALLHKIGRGVFETTNQFSLAKLASDTHSRWLAAHPKKEAK